MANLSHERLIFWPFFERIERELSYERWIDKYFIFVKALTKGHIPYEEDLSSFKLFCKILYLQDHQHEVRFEELLEQAIQLEKKNLIELLRSAQQAAEKNPKPPKPEPVLPPPDPNPIEHEEPDDPTVEEPDDPLESAKIVTYEDETEFKYFHPKINVQDYSMEEQRVSPLNNNEKFLHTDEYFPAHRREMIKAWQYLRREEKSGFGQSLDIPATVLKVAKEGLFLDPVYQPKLANRQDTLLILADSRGSMTPFQELTRRLIKTATHEGGHRRAPVYYFQNYPMGTLYRKANLTEPVKIGEALQKSSSQSTFAFIISDAGSARGNTDEQSIANRLEATMEFLEILGHKTAYLIWLNPMPRHRWKGTPAEEIARKVTTMIPILEQEDYNFQDIIRLIVKYKGKRF